MNKVVLEGAADRDFPQEPAGFLTLAIQHRDAGDLEQAEAILAQALERFPNLLLAARELARLAMLREDWPAAARHLAILRQRFPTELSGYVQGATVYRTLGAVAEVEAVLGELLHRFPGQMPAALEYASFAAGRGEMLEAKTRWLAIPTGCVEPDYFAIAEQLWRFAVITSQFADFPAIARAVLAQAVAPPGEPLPAFITSLFLMREQQPALALAAEKELQAFLATCRTLTPAGELMACCLGLSCPQLDRLALAQKYMLDPRFENLCALFYAPENLQILQGIVQSMLDAGSVDRLSSAQAYHIAKLVSCADQDLCARFVAAATVHAPSSVPSTDSLSVLLQIAAGRQRAGTHTAALHQNRLRIALCVSGQLRGYRSALATWHHMGLADHDLDVFVHSWTKVGRKAPLLVHAYRVFPEPFLGVYVDAVTRLGEPNVKARFPTLFAFFAGGDAATVDELRALYKTDHVVLQDDSAEPFAKMPNPVKMYYKAEACYELAAQTCKDYDLVIRIRPDKAMEASPDLDWREIARRATAERRIFVDIELGLHPSLGYVVGDQFAVGDGECMAHYSRAHSFTREAFIESRYGVPRHFAPHTNFAHAMLHNGIQVDVLKSLRLVPSPLDPGPLDAERLRALISQDIGAAPRDEWDVAFLAACVMPGEKA